MNKTNKTLSTLTADAAYRAYCQTEEYKEAFDEAKSERTIDNALWSAFAAGFDASHANREAGKYSEEEFEESGRIGERDGYEQALAEIDRETGGDGEYRVNTVDPERNCPDAETMKAKIVERFEALSTPTAQANETTPRDAVTAYKVIVMRQAPDEAGMFDETCNTLSRSDADRAFAEADGAGLYARLIKTVAECVASSDDEAPSHPPTKTEEADRV